MSGNGHNREIEAMAAEAAKCTKLKELRPKIERIHDYYTDHMRGSVTVAGCRSFREFCTKKLDRTTQAVYAMLGDYRKRKSKPKKTPSLPAAPPPLEVLVTSNQGE